MAKLKVSTRLVLLIQHISYRKLLNATTSSKVISIVYKYMFIAISMWLSDVDSLAKYYTNGMVSCICKAHLWLLFLLDSFINETDALQVMYVCTCMLSHIA